MNITKGTVVQRSGKRKQIILQVMDNLMLLSCEGKREVGNFWCTEQYLRDYGFTWEGTDVPKMALCLDCDKKYEDFGIDITLPTAQWNSICPEDGLLCGGCIVNRCASLKGAIAIRAVVEVKHILV